MQSIVLRRKQQKPFAERKHNEVGFDHYWQHENESELSLFI